MGEELLLYDESVDPVQAGEEGTRQQSDCCTPKYVKSLEGTFLTQYTNADIKLISYKNVL